MTLPWIRLETGFAQNPKVLDLIDRKQHRAALGYVFGLAYSGAQETDGFIPKAALPFLHLTHKDALSLIDARLWEHAVGGYQIRDFLDYQPGKASHKKRRAAARKGACSRWHGPDCDCGEADATA